MDNVSWKQMWKQIGSETVLITNLTRESRRKNYYLLTITSESLTYSCRAMNISFSASVSEEGVITLLDRDTNSDLDPLTLLASVSTDISNHNANVFITPSNASREAFEQVGDDYASMIRAGIHQLSESEMMATVGGNISTAGISQHAHITPMTDHQSSQDVAKGSLNNHAILRHIEHDISSSIRSSDLRPAKPNQRRSAMSLLRGILTRRSSQTSLSRPKTTRSRSDQPQAATQAPKPTRSLKAALTTVTQTLKSYSTNPHSVSYSAIDSALSTLRAGLHSDIPSPAAKHAIQNALNAFNTHSELSHGYESYKLISSTKQNILKSLDSLTVPKHILPDIAEWCQSDTGASIMQNALQLNHAIHSMAEAIHSAPSALKSSLLDIQNILVAAKSSAEDMSHNELKNNMRHLAQETFPASGDVPSDSFQHQVSGDVFRMSFATSVDGNLSPNQSKDARQLDVINWIDHQLPDGVRSNSSDNIRSRIAHLSSSSHPLAQRLTGLFHQGLYSILNAKMVDFMGASEMMLVAEGGNQDKHIDISSSQDHLTFQITFPNVRVIHDGTPIDIGSVTRSLTVPKSGPLDSRIEGHLSFKLSPKPEELSREQYQNLQQFANMLSC